MKVSENIESSVQSSVALTAAIRCRSLTHTISAPISLTTIASANRISAHPSGTGIGGARTGALRVLNRLSVSEQRPHRSVAIVADICLSGGGHCRSAAAHTTRLSYDDQHQQQLAASSIAPGIPFICCRSLRVSVAAAGRVTSHQYDVTVCRLPVGRARGHVVCSLRLRLSSRPSVLRLDTFTHAQLL